MQGFFSEGGHTTVPCGHGGFFYVVLAAYAQAATQKFKSISALERINLEKA